MGPVEKALREAWELIKDPNNRCTGVFATTASGDDIYLLSNDACKFCSFGAIYRVTNVDGMKHGTDLDIKTCNRAVSYLRDASIKFGAQSVVTFSDVDVINNPPKLYAKAIESAAKDGV